jgi:hypothetical protein
MILSSAFSLWAIFKQTHASDLVTSSEWENMLRL